MSSCSVSVSRDKRQELKWFPIDSLQFLRLTDCVMPLEVPHVPLYFENHDKNMESPSCCLQIVNQINTKISCRLN